MTASYDSRKRLEACEFPHLNRQVGVFTGSPFHHRGLGAEYVDVSREIVVVNTATFGTCHPVAEVAAAVRADTASTIANLDGLIVELTAHRDRLVAELTRLADQPVDHATAKESSND
ncbi:hypothetical protein [Nocardia brasiliensis]|uniref:hypothetical protein n=1 Tax=Nocardia brasiliensis TaxID=37326 RepID=UPI0024590805|nr:hypothetical protein [Nocardia brasiliensis]